MKHNLLLTITSLLSILLFTFHLSDDIVRGFEPGGLQTSLRYPSWSSGCTERWCSPDGDRVHHHPPRVAPWVGRPCRTHEGRGLVGGRIANSSGNFFWVWTLLALGVTALFSVILSVRGLWSFPGAASRSSPTIRR